MIITVVLVVAPEEGSLLYFTSFLTFGKNKKEKIVGRSIADVK